MSVGLDDEVLRQIVDAIDRVYQELFCERNLAFIDDAEQKAFYFERHNRGDRRWGAANVCMYPSCSDRSIPRSHTLSRSGPLKRIAEGGHVVTPTFDRSRGRVTAGRVGVREASTFPGFCEAHEAMFRGFEQRKELSTEEDYTLQFFRLVCREIRVRELETEKLRGMAADHLELMERRGGARIRELLGPEFLNNYNLDSFEFKEVDSRLVRIVDRVKNMEECISSYRNQFLAPLLAEIEGAPDKHDQLTLVAVSIGTELPVSLGGRGNFQCRDKHGVTRETIAFACVWPSDNRTVVAFLARNERHNDLAAYIASWNSRPLGLLSMIESWMVHGTDHWFMRPSAWKAIPVARQDQILADILDDSRNVGSEYPHSIFDSVRMQAAQEFTATGATEAANFALEMEKLRRLT